MTDIQGAQPAPIVYLVEWQEDRSRCMEAFGDDISALAFIADNLPKLPRLHKLAMRGPAFSATGGAINAEMLQALQGVVRVADRATVEFDAARAAIAKATGAQA